MKPFRKNVAIAIDGGGIRGIIVTQALSILETFLNKSVHDIFFQSQYRNPELQILCDCFQKIELLF